MNAKNKNKQLKGGIVLDSAKEKSNEGIVVVGTGRVLDNGEKVAPEVKEGDRVVNASGSEVKRGDENT